MKQEKYQYTISSLTLVTTFLMGFIDAYTFSERGGTFVSAQTGNMISFSAKFFTGQWSAAIGHIFVFIGFAVGAYIGEAIIQKSTTYGIQRYRAFIFIQTILLLILAIFQPQIDDKWMVLFLGLLAGYELTIFRKFRNTKINNGIMTGNTKNLMNNLYLSLHEKDKEATKHWVDLAITISIFIIGAGVGILLTSINEYFVLWIAFTLNLTIWLWLKIQPKTAPHE